MMIQMIMINIGALHVVDDDRSNKNEVEVL
jgi:hypothetical protein